jgi:hypothetical protein
MFVSLYLSVSLYLHVCAYASEYVCVRHLYVCVEVTRQRGM